MSRSPSRDRAAARTGRTLAGSSGGGGGGGSFDPATLTGVLRWLRAKDGISNSPSYITAMTASSSFPGETVDRLFKLNPANAWDTNGTATGWIKAQLSAATVVNSYTILYRSGNATRHPKDWTFEGSNDDSNWTVLDTRTNVTDWATALRHTYTFTNSTAYSYYRLNVSANNGDSYLSMGSLWFDAWLPIVTGTKSWVDAYNGQRVHTYAAGGGSTAAATPSGGTAATFASSGGFVLGSLAGGTAVEAWIVVKANGANSTHLWKLGEVGDVGFYPYSDGKVYEEAGLPTGQRQSFTPSVAVSGWRLYRVVNDGTTWQAWLDNSSQATASSKAVTWPTIVGVLGAGTVVAPVPFSGQVAEVLIRNVKSTTQEVTDLIAYFNAEHGLTVT